MFIYGRPLIAYLLDYFSSYVPSFSISNLLPQEEEIGNLY